MHSSSDIVETLWTGVTSMHSLPIRTTGQAFLHSWRHFFGLHLSELTIAILVSFSAILIMDARVVVQDKEWAWLIEMGVAH